MKTGDVVTRKGYSGEWVVISISPSGKSAWLGSVDAVFKSEHVLITELTLLVSADAEVKHIESYCAEVEIARRAAESEVTALKAQITAVDSDEFFSRVFNALPSSGRVYFSKRRGAVTWPEIRHAVRAALSTGNGER